MSWSMTSASSSGLSVSVSPRREIGGLSSVGFADICDSEEGDAVRLIRRLNAIVRSARRSVATRNAKRPIHEYATRNSPSIVSLGMRRPSAMANGKMRARLVRIAVANVRIRPLSPVSTTSRRHRYRWPMTTVSVTTAVNRMITTVLMRADSKVYRLAVRHNGYIPACIPMIAKISVRHVVVDVVPGPQVVG